MEAHPVGYDRILKMKSMIQNVEKSPKVALCRACRGTGVVQRPTALASLIFRKRNVNITEEACHQCGGSGRGIVSAKKEQDIQPYNPKKE